MSRGPRPPEDPTRSKADVMQLTNVQWDRMEAEKSMMLMMGKKRILQTMAVAKRIMQRQVLIREQEGETDTEPDEEPVKPARRVGRKGTNEVRSVRRRGNPAVQTKKP